MEKDSEKQPLLNLKRQVLRWKCILTFRECSSIPGIDEMIRDNSLWSFFGLWYGDYLTSSSGGTADVYTTEEDLIKMYNAENSITLESYAGVYGHRN